MLCVCVYMCVCVLNTTAISMDMQTKRTVPVLQHNFYTWSGVCACEKEKECLSMCVLQYVYVAWHLHVFFQYSDSSQNCVETEEDCADYHVFFCIPIAVDIVLRQKKIVQIIMSFSVFR